MNLMFDMDGWVADFVLGFTRLAHMKFGNSKRVFGCGGSEVWGFTSGAGVDTGYLTKEENREMWETITQDTYFWTTLPSLLTPADHKALTRLHAQHDITWITSRNGIKVEEQTKQWLRQTGLPNPDNVIIAGDDKGKFIQEHGKYDIAVDDGPHQITRMVMAGQFVVIRDFPYNRTPEVNMTGMPRVGGIAEFELWMEQSRNKALLEQLAKQGGLPVY